METKHPRRVPKEFARLTEIDRAIFDSRMPLAVEADYRFADQRAAARMTAVLRHDGGFIGYVARGVAVALREQQAVRS